MTLSDRHRELIEETRTANRARQQAGKSKPVPQRIGDRDPLTGNYSALYPDGSETANGRKLYDAHSVKGDMATGLPLTDGTIGLLGQKGQLSPLTLPEQEGVRGIATQGALKDNNVGYINGQVWNYEEEVVEEIGFELDFFGIRATDQVYTFRGGGVTKEVSFANADRIVNGQGLITTRIRTTNRKLKLTFEGAIDGTKQTTVGASFYVLKRSRLPVTISVRSEVAEGNSAGGEKELTNWLVLNSIRLTGDDFDLGDFDATSFVQPPFPASSTGFVDRPPGEYAGETIKGIIPAFNTRRDHFIFIFDQSDDNGYYTYKTTWEFAFK
jgi:hypothetical protein